LQEIHHRVDFLFGQKPVSSERRHHGQRIALGFVIKDGDEIVAIGIFAFDVDEFRADRAGQVATLDDMAGQAIALAAVERNFLPLGGGRLCVRWSRKSRADQQRQNESGLDGESGNQRRFPDNYGDDPFGI